MVLTQSELNEAVKACGFPAPEPELHEQLVAATGDDFSREELAMLVAQMIYESEGFQYREDKEYVGRAGHGEFIDEDGVAGKDYHGRGYIKLTWVTNYKACSRELGLGDRLLAEPELVANSTQLAVQVAVWYWRAIVRPELGPSADCFGLTTRAINGSIECSGGFNQQAYDRYQVYLNVARAMNIKNLAKEDGCYN